MLARYLGKDDLNIGEIYQIKIIEENIVEVYGAQWRQIEYRDSEELKKNWERLE